MDTPINMSDFFPNPEPQPMAPEILDGLLREKLSALGISEEFLKGGGKAEYAEQMTQMSERVKEFARGRQKQMIDALKRTAIVSSHCRGVNVHTIYPTRKVTKFRSRRTAKVWVKNFRASIK